MLQQKENTEKKPMITCIVPAYYSGDALYKAINSVMSQSYSCVELIVTDDGSNDFSTAKTISYIQNNNNHLVAFKVLHHNQNVGTVKNINHAIKQSHGEYIVFLAADDTFANNDSLVRIEKEFRDYDCEILIANNASSYKGKYFEKLKKKYINKQRNKLYKMLCIENFISGSVISYKRSYFDIHGFFNEKYKLVEDWPEMLKAAKLNLKMHYIDFKTISYSIDGVSNKKKKPEQYIRDFKRIMSDEILSKDDITFFVRRYNEYMIKRLDAGLLESSKLGMNFLWLDVVVYKTIRKGWSYLNDKI